MRKGAILLVMALLLTMIVPAYAAENRFATVSSSIRFSNSTATCSVNIDADKAADVITATVTLWREACACLAQRRREIWIMPRAGTLRPSGRCLSPELPQQFLGAATG